MPTPSDPLPGLGAWADETEPPPPPPAPRSRDLAAALEQLEQRFGNRFTVNETIRQQHGHTLTWTANEPPDAVVYPQTTEEVAEIVKICAAHRVPVIAFGTGTSLEGHVNAPLGGVCVDTSHDEAHRSPSTPKTSIAWWKPGVTRKELNDAPARHGPVLPHRSRRRRLHRRHGLDARVGHQRRALRHDEGERARADRRDRGRRDHAHGARAQESRRRATTSRGCSSARKGTLGIITEITLRLHGMPEVDRRRHLPVPQRRRRPATPRSSPSSRAFPSRASNCSTNCPCARSTSIPSSDFPKRRCCSSNSTARRRASREQAERFGDIAAELGGGPFTWAAKPEERTKLWQARHDAYWAGLTLRPGAKGLATDVCVPISRLAECVTQTQADIARSRAWSRPIIGHVGDGNFHVNLLFDMDDADEVAPRRRLPRTPRGARRSPWTAPAPASTASARRR